MLTVYLVLYLTAFVCAVISATGKPPVWLSVSAILLAIAGLLQVLPKS